MKLSERFPVIKTVLFGFIITAITSISNRVEAQIPERQAPNHPYSPTVKKPAKPKKKIDLDTVTIDSSHLIIDDKFQLPGLQKPAKSWSPDQLEVIEKIFRTNFIEKIFPFIDKKLRTIGASEKKTYEGIFNESIDYEIRATQENNGKYEFFVLIGPEEFQTKYKLVVLDLGTIQLLPQPDGSSLRVSEFFKQINALIEIKVLHRYSVRLKEIELIINNISLSPDEAQYETDLKKIKDRLNDYKNVNLTDEERLHAYWDIFELLKTLKKDLKDGTKSNTIRFVPGENIKKFA